MVNDDGPTLITLTDEDVQRAFDRIMSSTPYATPGALRDAVFAGGPFCCANCHDWHHPNADAWRDLETWLFLTGEDWRTVG